MAVTNLTNTTWLLNTTVRANYNKFPFSINFVDGSGTQFSSMSVVDVGFMVTNLQLKYDDVIAFTMQQAGYSDDPLYPTAEKYRTIKILGGTDVTNEYLETWLLDNSESHSTTYSSTITLENCTCNKSNDNFVSGMYIAEVTANNGYYFETDNSVTSTLGSVMISTNRKKALILIDNVTENFIITASATETFSKNIVLHPDNDGDTDYGIILHPELNSATTQEINKIFKQRYTITTNITNGIATGAEYMYSDESVIIEITPNSGYYLPNSIVVNGALSLYTKINGRILLFYPTGNITITATCPNQSQQITDLTNTSWHFNDTLNVSSDFNYSVYFSSFINTFKGIYCDSTNSEFGYIRSDLNIQEELYNTQDGWKMGIYRTITITGGTDVNNNNLINWLLENATMTNE